MAKHKKQVKQSSFWCKLFRFFFPKDWKSEVMKGRMLGEQMKRGDISPKFVPSWWLGKWARKLVDPKRKAEVNKKE